MPIAERGGSSSSSPLAPPIIVHLHFTLQSRTLYRDYCDCPLPPAILHMAQFCIHLTAKCESNRHGLVCNWLIFSIIVWKGVRKAPLYGIERTKIQIESISLKNVTTPVVFFSIPLIEFKNNFHLLRSIMFSNNNNPFHQKIQWRRDLWHSYKIAILVYFICTLMLACFLMSLEYVLFLFSLLL